MKKLFMIFLMLVFCLGFVNIVRAEVCSICNETCSPCGGGCTATELNGMFDGVTDFDNVVGDITGWNTSCVTNMEQMFAGSDFNQEIGGWDISSVTVIQEMFAESDFNQDISSWDTGNIINMEAVFVANIVFNQDLNNWNTSNVIRMTDMFSGATAFNGNISEWDTSNVDELNYMFYGATSFNQYIGQWNTSNCSTFYNMFQDAIAFNQDISDWDISNGSNLKNMFDGAISFNQDIGNWNISNVYNMQYMFNNVTLSTANYDAILNGWSSQEILSNVIFDGGNSQYSSAGLSARNDTLIGIYNWTITDGGLFEEEPECVTNENCSLCEKCVDDFCVNQTDIEDLKNECEISFTTCLNGYTLQGSDGYCDGSGSCDIDDNLLNVTEGNACYLGMDMNPTIAYKCDIWINCIENEVNASQYYVGYTGDGTDTCIETDWKFTGAYWYAPNGQTISETSIETENCVYQRTPEKLETEKLMTAFITLMMVSIIIIFLVEKVLKKGMGKIGMSKISVYLFMFLMFSVKVLALEPDFRRENMLLDVLITLIILGFLYLIYLKLFKME